MTTIAITLGYVDSKIWEESALRFYETCGVRPDAHYFLNQHWPMDKIENAKRNKEICERHGIRWIDAGENLGLARGFNWVLNLIDYQPDDVIVGYDPDSFPITEGWVTAFKASIENVNNLAWVSMQGTRSREELFERGYRVRAQDSKTPELWFTERAVVNSICAFRGSYLKITNGFQANDPIYGHLESPMFDLLKQHSLEWGFLPQYVEDDRVRNKCDFKYTVWKWHKAHLRTYDKDFESWLTEGMPGLSETERNLILP